MSWVCLLASWPNGLPAGARTCHDVLHHRDEVGRPAEGGRVVVLVLDGRDTDRLLEPGRPSGLVSCPRGGWVWLARRSLGLGVQPEPGGVSRGRGLGAPLAGLQFGEGGQALGRHVRARKMEKEGSRWSCLYSQLPCSPAGLPVLLQTYSVPSARHPPCWGCPLETSLPAPQDDGGRF